LAKGKAAHRGYLLRAAAREIEIDTQIRIGAILAGLLLAGPMAPGAKASTRWRAPSRRALISETPQREGRFVN